MRHGKKVSKLGRTKAHREAMLSNMAVSLVKHKRIFTTTAKAKALRKFVEPLITKSKTNTTHSRRVVFSYLQDKDAIKELFSTVATQVAERPGGYTRILKTHFRAGDNAEMCMMELVDFNENMLSAKASSTKKTEKAKRTRRGKSKKSEDTSEVKASEENVDKSTAEVTPDLDETSQDNSDATESSDDQK
jgi:large subunit ribosomal protein L17